MKMPFFAHSNVPLTINKDGFPRFFCTPRLASSVELHRGSAHLTASLLLNNYKNQKKKIHYNTI